MTIPCVCISGVFTRASLPPLPEVPEYCCSFFQIYLRVYLVSGFYFVSVFFVLFSMGSDLRFTCCHSILKTKVTREDKGPVLQGGRKLVVSQICHSQYSTTRPPWRPGHAVPSTAPSRAVWQGLVSVAGVSVRGS